VAAPRTIAIDRIIPRRCILVLLRESVGYLNFGAKLSKLTDAMGKRQRKSPRKSLRKSPNRLYLTRAEAGIEVTVSFGRIAGIAGLI
jgi:hypothetical protein